MFCFSEIKTSKCERRVKLKEVGIFADGVAVSQIGKTTFKMIRDRVDDVCGNVSERTGVCG